ncbi:MAG: hypothetical protein V4638_01390 [Bacteroidota bacterium]
MSLQRNLFLMFGLLLFSCAQEGKEIKAVKKDSDPFLFNLQHFNNESENYMSFPLWFNRQIIKKKKISTITHQLFHVSSNTAEENESNQLDIREIKSYHFNKNGSIEKLKVSYFYDDRPICEVLFTYKGEGDKWGYYAEVDRQILTKEVEGFIAAELPFHIFKQIKSSKKVLSYVSLKDKQLHHYMLDKNFYGALSVDSIIHPGSKDAINLGSPNATTKKYQVTNKVHETNVKSFHYTNNQFEGMTKEDYPFNTKRSVLKSEEGICNELIDSLFSDNNFISRTFTLFKMNEQQLPLEIKKNKQNPNNEIIPITVEKISYEYFH